MRQGAIVPTMLQSEARSGPRMTFGLLLAIGAKMLTDINATSGIQTQAYSTSVIWPGGGDQVLHPVNGAKRLRQAQRSHDAVFAYWGWDACLPISEETKDPHKNPGKAAVLATILVLGTYVLISYAIQAFAGFGTTGIDLNNPQNANDTLSILGEPVVGSGLAVVLLLAISSSSVASVLTCLAPTARSMLAMAVYRALPQPFAKVHAASRPRGSAPSWFRPSPTGHADGPIPLRRSLRAARGPAGRGPRFGRRQR